MEDQRAQMEEMMQMLRCYEKARSEGFAPENMELEALLSAMKQQENSNEGDIKMPGSQEKETDVEREEILPNPFFVAKTFNEHKQKVFINICGSDKIPGPENWEQGMPPSVQEALANMETDEESVQNVRFPLSCTEPLISKDHCGKSCLVHDVVYNTLVVETAMVDKRLKTFIIETALTWISQKYNTQLNSDCKLPNMKYKGDRVRTQFIRAAPKGPLISEIPDEEAELEPAFPLLARKEDSVHPSSSCVPVKQVETVRSITDSSKQEQEEEVRRPPIEHVEKSSKQLKEEMAIDSNESKYKDTIENIRPSLTKQKVYKASLGQPEESSRDIKEDQNRNSDPTIPIHEVPQLDDSSKAKDVQVEQHDDGILQFPVVQTEYVGRPVEYAFVHISFPHEVNMENVKVCASNNEVFIETWEFEPLQVPLVIPVSPENAEAEFFRTVLTIRLPYLGYRQLFCCNSKSL